ncbi:MULTISPECIES: ADP-ribosylglycohydrolase family protein [unclassified Paenibacillus]|uniref:ADP-ribosylglycohydrolase family protein n=1 Tax=unclassified Paenibacillus TaxID=185978 RepID=UPI000970E7E4|nr:MULTISPECIES: ADP-ribosylglycohydrolase family protein [unclassified Paenibacillus]ASS66022.1 ADP-ribosylglycohydrolase family protein [Paenibacillus sp. RUD330]
MMPKSYVETVYAGFIGMNVGIRLGAPIEPVAWTYERIRDVYGDIRNYVKSYSTFAADDDANGPVFFVRALYDDADGRELTPEDVGKAWLNYAREGIGMFWWGGEDISTEHRAYLNLRKGIPAPRSGSIEVNGLEMAEQIGGQIFIDSWGLLFPGNPEKAAEYAEKAASVSHDGNGLHGARFMAACIAKAFDASSVQAVIAEGLRQIPGDSTYARVVNAVLDFHKRRPGDWQACRQYLEDHWGYDKYTGVCHIIPNAGVCVLALLYGEGDFARTVEIASMCGWDTDCNAGNVGTILGVYSGLAGIPDHYREPINDFIVASSVSGYLNLVDFPTFAKELALLGFRVNGQVAPQDLKESFKPGEVFFDFDLPGSTHGFRTSNPFKTPVVRHSALRSRDGSRGSLEVVFDRLVTGDSSKIYWKPFYRRAEFNDEKYKPVFSPLACSGQTVSAAIYADQWEGEPIVLTPYIRNTFTQKEMLLEPIKPANGQWNEISFVIPDTDGALIDEIGWILESPSPLLDRALGSLFIGRFHVGGAARYSIDFAKQAKEFGSITPFSHHRGKWELEGGVMVCRAESDAASFSGNYYGRDMIVEATVQPLEGISHLLIARAQGVMRHYLAGFDGRGTVSFIKQDFGTTRLFTAKYDWEPGQEYRFKLTAVGDAFTLEINGENVLECRDPSFGHGMFGFGCLEGGVSGIKDAAVRALPDGEKA